MDDSRKNKKQLISELEQLRGRLAESEGHTGEAALRESEARFRAIADSVHAIVAYVDHEQRFQFNNREFLDWFGINPAEQKGKHIREVMGDAAYQKALPLIRAVLEGEEQQFEMEAPYKDAGTRSVQGHYIPHFGENAQVLGFYAVITDITGRRQAEDALQESGLKYQTLIEQASDGIFITDGAGKYLEVNLRGCEMLGCGQDELLHYNVRDFVPPEEMANFQSRNSQIDRGESIIFERDMLRHDGSRFPAEISARKLDDGRTFAIVRDISKRQDTEEQLRDSQRLLQTVFDTIPQWIVVKSAEDKYIMVNSAFATSFGRTPSDFVGQQIGYLNIGSDAQRRKISETDHQVISSGQTSISELILTLKDGEERVFHDIKLPLRNDLGEVVGLVGVSEDITARRALEQQLRQSQKMEALGTLAGGIAHDFNNLLQPILGFTDLVKSNLPADGREREFLSVVARNAHRAKDLVSQILLFSRRARTEKAAHDLGPVAREIVDFMRSALPKSIAVHAHIASDALPVICDPTQMYQVLLNLCVNAGQAMPEAGELTLRAENVDLEGVNCIIGKTLSGKLVRFTVSDSGVGMDRKTLSRIFEPFFTTRQSGEGTGLGLATVFGIVQDHEGGICVTSEPGEGTTFEVFLPAAGQQTKESASSQPTAPRGSETILFVDDEEEITALGKITLERLGYTVIATTSGQQALEIFGANPDGIDLVVSDLGMPDINGERLAAEIRKEKPELPIILCTGYSETLNPETSKAAGINAFLYKPFDILELGRVVREVLDQARREKQ